MPADIIIRKQRLKVKTNDESYAFKVRKQVNDQLQYDLLPVYETAFGKIEEDLFIDKISIDLGVCNLEELNSQLPQKLKQALENWVIEEKRAGRWDQKRSDLQGNSLSTEKPKRKVDIVSALVYYLEKGIYPWWFKPNGKNISGIISELTEPETENAITALINLLRSSSILKKEIIVTRLLQTNEVLFGKAVIKLTDLFNNDRAKDEVLFLSAKQTINALKEWLFISEKNYLKSLLNYLLDTIEKKTAFDSNNFLLTLIDLTNKDQSLKKIEAEGLNIGSYSNDERKKPGLLPEKLKKIITEIYAALMFNDINEPASLQKNMPAKQKIIDDDNKLAVSDIFSEEEAIYISNAGIIILHPFLIPLFEELKLLGADNDFLSDECRIKAIVLLNYLCTGKDEYQEADLVFNKILCGSKPEDNLPDDILLSENEKNECDQLLNTVTNYWEALKGSGREAMQETFFMRSGRLSFNNNQYLLQVEKNATDILIERLPWGIGIIQLPWPAHLIYVEW